MSLVISPSMELSWNPNTLENNSSTWQHSPSATLSSDNSAIWTMISPEASKVSRTTCRRKTIKVQDAELASSMTVFGKTPTKEEIDEALILTKFFGGNKHHQISK